MPRQQKGGVLVSPEIPAIPALHSLRQGNSNQFYEEPLKKSKQIETCTVQVLASKGFCFKILLNQMDYRAAEKISGQHIY